MPDANPAARTTPTPAAANGAGYVLNVDFMRFAVRDDKTDKVKGKQPRFRKGDVLNGVSFTDEQLEALTSGRFPTIVKRENDKDD